MIPAQHLSDEAVAAFADGVLTGNARARAARHCAECAECADAVRDQREAVLVLRDAPAPPLPTDLLNRLRGLPHSTPLSAPPTVVLPDGSTMLSTTGGAGSLASYLPTQTAPTQPAPTQHRHRPNPFSTSLAAVVLAGALTAGAAGVASDESQAEPASDTLRPVVQRANTGTTPMTALFTSADVPRTGGR